MATLSHSDLMTLWVLNGGLQQDADVAAAIAQAESGGCQYAKHGPVDDRPVRQCVYNFSTGEDSYGLWQINRQAHPQYTPTSLYTTGGNAKAAADIRRARGNFTDWSTYKNNAYKQFLTGTVSVTPQQGTVDSTAPYSGPPLGLGGWADLRNTIARHLPTQVQRSAHVQRQAAHRLNRAARGFDRG